MGVTHVFPINKTSTPPFQKSIDVVSLYTVKTPVTLRLSMKDFSDGVRSLLVLISQNVT